MDRIIWLKDKGKGLPILDTERWARSWSRCTGSQPAGDHTSSTWRQAAITFRQACGYLPRHTASPPFGRYQVILHGDRDTQVWTTCPRLLRSVASSRIWTCDLLIASPTLYPLHYTQTHCQYNVAQVKQHSLLPKTSSTNQRFCHTWQTARLWGLTPWCWHQQLTERKWIVACVTIMWVRSTDRQWLKSDQSRQLEYDDEITQLCMLTRSNKEGHSASAICVSFIDDADWYRLRSTNIQWLVHRLDKVLSLSEHPDSACTWQKINQLEQ